MFTLLYNHIRKIANKAHYILLHPDVGKPYTRVEKVSTRGWTVRLHPGVGSHNKLQTASKCIYFGQVMRKQRVGCVGSA